MNLRVISKDKEYFLEVSYFSFLKCWVLTYLGFLVIVFSIAFIIGIIFGLIGMLV